MSQQALYRKWRSRSFDEVVGQDHVVQTLRNAVSGDRLAHAYLFSGPRGTGKTSTARIVAKVVNCLAPEAERPCDDCHICRSISDGSSLDLIEIDAASNTQVDKVRDVIVDKINFEPNEARRKVYIIDEVHMLSNSAFNALLKTLEEPPAHAMFILATTEIHKIPATILSRCQRLDFRRIGVEEIAAHLAHVLAQEGAEAEPAVLDLVARQATGSMRDALSLLDQLLAHGDRVLTLEQSRSALGLARQEAVEMLLDRLIDRDTAGALALLNRLLDEGADPRQFLTDLLEQLRALLLTLASRDRVRLNLPESSLERLRAQAERLPPGTLIQVIRLFNQAGADLRLSLQPQLPLELAIVEAVLLFDAATGSGVPTGLPAAPAAGPDRSPPPSPEPAPSTGTPGAAAETAVGPPPAAPQAERPAPAVSTPTPPPAAVAPPPSAPEGERRTLGWWQAEWASFITFLTERDEAGQRAALRLKFSSPHRLEEDRLELGFYYTIHLEKIRTDAERRVVEHALADFAGRPLTVSCKLVPKAEAAPPTRTRFEQAAEDPIVKEALKLGGRIVEVQPPDQG